MQIIPAREISTNVLKYAQMCQENMRGQKWTQNSQEGKC